MTFSRTIGKTVLVIVGLMFLIGSGCGQKDDSGKKVAIEYLRKEVADAKAEKDAAEAKADCYIKQTNDTDRLKNCGT